MSVTWNNITVGLGLEFLVPTRDGEPDEKVWGSIRDIIDRVDAEVDLHKHDIPTSNEAYHHWVVKRNPTLETYEGDSFTKVEINTPILTPFDLDVALPTVMEKISAAGNPITINTATCGYYVHVGLRGGFELLTLKKLGTMLWLAEDLLLGLYSPARRGNEHQPLSSCSCLGVAAEKIREKHSNPEIADMEFLVENNAWTQNDKVEYDDWVNLWQTQISAELYWQLSKIWKASEKSDLTDILAPANVHTGRRLAYHLGDVYIPTSPPTVQFRRMGATDDAILLEDWPTVCCQLVQFAQDSDQYQYQHLIRKITEEIDYDLWQMLRDIGCGPGVALFITHHRAYECWRLLIEARKFLEQKDFERAEARAQWAIGEANGDRTRGTAAFELLCHIYDERQKWIDAESHNETRSGQEYLDQEQVQLDLHAVQDYADLSSEEGEESEEEKEPDEEEESEEGEEWEEEEEPDEEEA